MKCPMPDFYLTCVAVNDIPFLFAEQAIIFLSAAQERLLMAHAPEKE